MRGGGDAFARTRPDVLVTRVAQGTWASIVSGSRMASHRLQERAEASVLHIAPNFQHNWASFSVGHAIDVVLPEIGGSVQPSPKSTGSALVRPHAVGLTLLRHATVLRGECAFLTLAQC